ncbi:DNA phosphorothioation-dependent restriction protein DptF [Idiomarina sp. A28L]|uniref:DNA phosphorothioation-dependent restriction protein DptF n=1 Tax=Idiomarina sp. A28L TaxID=1036674 RepID=UPI000213868A|nr:DNA phosphorothioation-dependent restriction protein DptF [Idiomarina sp. A28L]EGN74192.1 DNA phosphorothioation-dependent restriction protein DptF [Idiomarina sp. A28L]
MRLREVLSVLSKSSPYAVKTDREPVESDDLDAVKDYLYVETDIEQDFHNQLKSLNAAAEKKVIFLCGSSGDGKSEILTRYSKQYQHKAHFHLDATHSFGPKETAIERLDKVFSDYDIGTQSLVVGINTGMLGNYSEEGANEQFKQAIKSFLQKSEVNDEFVFLDFEQYPKFKMDAHFYSSKFTEQLLQRITAQDNNIIRQFFDEEKVLPIHDTTLCLNFELLSIPSVQRIVVESLFKARLMKDQFLTARALLDFVYHLFSGDSYLSENLFTCSESEIVAKIADFDPALLRTKLIDQFVLSHKLGINDNEFESFKSTLKDRGFDLRKLRSPESNIRLFYVLQHEDIGNNYHHRFQADFSDSLLDKYSTIWRLHRTPEAPEAKHEIRVFYRDVLLTAISKFNNRNAPQLSKDELLLATRGGFHIAAHVDIKQDNSAIKLAAAAEQEHVGFFHACLKVDEQPIKKVAININLLGLLYRICEGYQPNKHDKNAVVLLDELVEELHERASKAKTLLVLRDSTRLRVYDAEGDGSELEVSGGVKK